MTNYDKNKNLGGQKFKLCSEKLFYANALVGIYYLLYDIRDLNL